MKNHHDAFNEVIEMKALDIDPYSEIIQEVDATDRLETLRKGADLGVFEEVTFNYGGEQYIIYFDDTNLMWLYEQEEELIRGFYFRPCSRLVIGGGTIVGRDENGSHANPRLTARDIREMVLWAELSPAESA
jgi:hypothetical protein